MMPSSSSSSVFTVREAVYALLRDFGIFRIFGNPGSTELPMFRHFPEDFEYVLGLQEAVAVGMADGYAQASGNAAVVNLHSAAGVGNAMGNLYTAFKNQTPLIVIAGQQARSLLPYDPYLSSAQPAELPRPYVKFSIQPARAEDVPAALARAYYMAMQPPKGPVLVSVPVDDWARTATRVDVRQVSQRIAPDPEGLRMVAEALNQAQSPVLVVGSSIDRDQAWEDVVALAERQQTPVLVAPFNARCSFPEDHPLFAGFLPAARERIVARLAPHDVIVVLGAPAFIYHVEGEGPFVPPGAALYQLTEDPELASWAPVGASVVGQVGLAVRGLLEQVHPRLAGPGSLRSPASRVQAVRAPATEPMSVAFALQSLADVRDPADIVVEEVPSSRLLMHEYLPMLQPETFYTMASGGLGYAMPAAVGIAMARPDKRVICLVGDGSLMYSPQALWSAVQHKLNITFVIINNAGYGAMKRFAGVFGFEADEVVPGIALPGLDFMALAQAHGCPGVRVTAAVDAVGNLQQALSLAGPVVVEMVVEPAV